MLEIGTLAAFAVLATPLSAVAADCPERFEGSDLQEAALAVEEAWRKMDSDRVETATADATTAVECAAAILSEADVAAYFRVRGYAEFLAGDVPAAELSLLAARRIEPRYSIPTDLVGESHPIRKMFDTLAYRATADPNPLPRPAEGELIVDGSRFATSVPSERPFVFQRVDADGALAETIVADPGRIPEYVEYTPPVFVGVPDPPRRPISRSLLIAGVATSAAGTAGMLASAQVKKDWLSRVECASEDECQGMIRTNQTLGRGGIVVTAAGAALGVGAVAVGRW